MIGNVFVHARVDNVSDVNGLDVLEQDEEPHCDHRNCQTVANVEDGLVFQGIANLDGSDDEASVGEDHGPPPEMEVDGP